MEKNFEQRAKELALQQEALNFLAVASAKLKFYCDEAGEEDTDSLAVEIDKFVNHARLSNARQ